MLNRSVNKGTGQNGDNIQHIQNGDTPKRRHTSPFWYVAVLVVAVLDLSPF